MDMDMVTRHPLLRDQVLQILREEILHRRPVGAMMPPELDLARQLKVSRKTVRAAYAILEAEGLVERRRGLGTIIVEKTPRARRTGEIALVFFTSAAQMFTLPFYTRLIAEACRTAAARQFYVRLLTHDARKMQFRYDWREHTDELDEAVAALALGVFKPEALQALARRMPTIALDAGGPFDFCDSAAADDREAGRLATQHLLDLGHRRIGFLGNWRTSRPDEVVDPAHIRRYEGYKLAMQEAGVPSLKGLRFDMQFDAQATYRAVSAVLQQDDPPTAFVAVSGAAAAIDAALARGRRVPEDVSFVGIGDIDSPSDRLAMTTIALGPDEIGRAGIELLQRRLSQPDAPFEHRVIRVGLVQRETTAPPTL